MVHVGCNTVKKGYLERDWVQIHTMYSMRRNDFLLCDFAPIHFFYLKNSIAIFLTLRGGTDAQGNTADKLQQTVNSSLKPFQSQYCLAVGGGGGGDRKQNSF
jgi:hypothetical protein